MKVLSMLSLLFSSTLVQSITPACRSYASTCHAVRSPNFRFCSRRDWGAVHRHRQEACLYSSHRRLPTQQQPGSEAMSSMESLYQEWTLDQDKTLWENYERQKSVAELASMLGRGLRGVEMRLAKLKDVKSNAYQRLFGSSSVRVEENTLQKTRLVPVSEVIRRIRFDALLPTEKFSVLHYDRVEDSIVESALTAPNTSIKGPQALLVDALPEHRIVLVKYLEQIVWDRENRVDLVFSEPGIVNVMEQYDVWKRERDAVIEWNRQRQCDTSMRLQQALGVERFARFKGLVDNLQSAFRDPTISNKLEAERFVQSTIELFRENNEDDSDCAIDSARIPSAEYEELDLVSELIALHPDQDLRQVTLSELSLRMTYNQGKSTKPMYPTQRELPELREEDITETFIRGSGPGGQKINKTSNRVLLVHEPTQLRVECQETRSLQQNRKIARKRLQLKLDEYLHGSQSRERVKAQLASAKKSKAKARSRARQRRKQEAKEKTDRL